MIEPPESPPPLGDLVTARLRRMEVTMLARVLTTTLAGALPPTIVDIERRRTVRDRLTMRPGETVGVRVSADATTLTLRTPTLGVVETSISHTVRGVVLSHDRVSLADWLDRLGTMLNKIAAEDEAARAALERALLG